jgi:hypothetical protein
MKKFLRDNSLGLVLAAFFLMFWALQGWSGFLTDAKERRQHHDKSLTFGQYLASGHFWQATGENWESEFLQMGFYVLLSSVLFQRGSAESKDPDEIDEGDEPVSVHALDSGAPKAIRKGAILRWLYSYSLTLAFGVLFLLSFCLHAWGGYEAEKARALREGESPGTLWEFLAGSEFWFQSMQNWQSEFLAVLSIVTLSIFLRHHGSPESKEVWAPHRKTGK